MPRVCGEKQVIKGLQEKRVKQEIQVQLVTLVQEAFKGRLVQMVLQVKLVILVWLEAKG